MKHKKKRFCIGISLLCLLTAVVLLLPASANSAQTWFEGQDSTGAFMPEGSVVQGSSTDVKLVNRLGKVIAEKNYSGNLEDISVGDSAVAMAFGKNVIIADSNLKEKKTLESDSAIKKIALYSNEKDVFVIENSESKILK